MRVWEKFYKGIWKGYKAIQAFTSVYKAIQGYLEIFFSKRRDGCLTRGRVRSPFLIYFRSQTLASAMPSWNFRACSRMRNGMSCENEN